MTHDINADPELWELRELYGDRACLIWLECLSIADRNSGIIGPASDQTRNQLASKCRSSRTKVGLVLDWCRVRGWIKSDEYFRVAKWAKYNNSREDNKIPSYTSPSYTSPSETKTYKNAVEIAASPPPSAHLQNDQIIERHEPKWQEVADRLYESDKQRFKRLFAWANGVAAGGVAENHIRDALINIEAFEQRNGGVNDWYPYLKKILERTIAHSNARLAESKHQKLKEQESQWSDNLKNGTTRPIELVRMLSSQLAAKK